MKLRPALIASVIGIYVLSIVAAAYVGVRVAGRLPDLLGFHGSPYYRHWGAGNRDINRGDYRAAIREYDQMVRLRPHRAEGYLNRAIAEHHAELYDRAIQDNTTAISLLSQEKEIDAPGMTDQDQFDRKTETLERLYHNRALVYAAKNEMAQAIADDKQAIALRPNDIDGYETLSEHYGKNQQYGLDVANWKSAVQHMPDSSPCWANYGWAQYQFGHIPESIDSSRRAIALDPNAVTARYNLALCYAVTDRWSLAEPIYRKGIELDDAQESQGALSDVRDALRDHPQSQALRNAAHLLSQR